MNAFRLCWPVVRTMWRAWLGQIVVVVVVPVLVLAMPLLEKQLIDQVMVLHRLERLPQLVLLYGALWLAAAALQIAGSALGAYLGEKLTLGLRQTLFVHGSALSVAFARQEHSGRSVALLLNDVPAVAGMFTSTFSALLGSAVTLAVGVVLMFRLSWPLAIAAAVAPPVVAALASVLTRPLRPLARRLQDTAAELTQRLQEHYAGMREVVAFGQEQQQLQRLTGTLTDLLRLRMRLVAVDAGLSAGQSVFSLMVFLVIVGFGGYLVARGQTTVGTLIAIQSLFGQIYNPAKGLLGLIMAYQRGLGAADRVQEFLAKEPLVRERPGAVAPAQVAGAVTFEQVAFAYRAGEPVLDRVSFHAQPGELIALVGPSGAGKTTITSLIMRFYDPAAGRVLLDGVDLREITLTGLRRHIGVVFQDTFLFAASIRENLAFGQERVSEVEITAACRAAHAWEFIERLPRGLDTPVGERGAQFSEGQKQRLAIARALLRNPRIIILDEPTSALDARSEQLLQAALDTLMRGRTTFVIAHRLTTVLRADRILVLEGGRLVEQGRHSELLAGGGVYRELHDLQFAAASPVAVTTVAELAVAG